VKGRQGHHLKTLRLQSQDVCIQLNHCDSVQTRRTVLRRPFNPSCVFVRVVVQAVDVKPAKQRRFKSFKHIHRTRQHFINPGREFRNSPKQHKQCSVAHHAGIDILMFNETGIFGLRKKIVSLKHSRKTKLCRHMNCVMYSYLRMRTDVLDMWTLDACEGTRPPMSGSRDVTHTWITDTLQKVWPGHATNMQTPRRYIPRITQAV